MACGLYERNEPFTLSFWFKPLKDSLAGPILSRSGGYFNGGRGYELLLPPDGTLAATLSHTWPANSIEVHTVDKLPVSAWSHLVLTYDGSSRADGLLMYVNGEPARQQTITDHLKRSNHWLRKRSGNLGRR